MAYATVVHRGDKSRSGVSLRAGEAIEVTLR